MCQAHAEYTTPIQHHTKRIRSYQALRLYPMDMAHRPSAYSSYQAHTNHVNPFGASEGNCVDNICRLRHRPHVATPLEMLGGGWWLPRWSRMQRLVRHHAVHMVIIAFSIVYFIAHIRVHTAHAPNAYGSYQAHTVHATHMRLMPRAYISYHVHTAHTRRIQLIHIARTIPSTYNSYKAHTNLYQAHTAHTPSAPTHSKRTQLTPST